MSDYNPFDKPLSQLELPDLAILRSVSEGWYVEYKSEVPNASSIAKSISAFANTYGGWLFYGVTEKSKEVAVAGNFVGIPSAAMDAALQTIRQAVASSVNPAPYFDIKVLWGPFEEVGLSNDNGVICIHVPRGHATPFVHKKGMIYRRVGDGSEPKPENDRFILDQLWRRSQEIREEYAQWLDSDLELSEQEKGYPYLRIFLTPDLWRDMGLWAEIDTEKVREIFSKPSDSDTYFATPFDTVYRTAGGYVGRQVKNNDPNSLTATWFLMPNLTSMLILPLPTISNLGKLTIEEELEGYERAASFSAALAKHGDHNPTVLDLNFVFSALGGMFNIQHQLDALANRQGPLFVKAQFINTWRMRPFLDIEQVVSYQFEHGVPVCLKGDFFVPPGKGPDTFQEIPSFENTDDPKVRKFLQSMYAFEPIAAAMGIETGLRQKEEPDGTELTIYPDLMDACLRASKAQSLRNNRRRRQSGI